MKRYRVTRDYRSHAAVYTAGQIVELDDEFAAWVQRDSRGALELIVEPDPEPHAAEAPPADRMVKRPARRRGQR